MEYPLYSSTEAAIEAASAVPRDPACTLCKLHEDAQSVCIPAERVRGSVPGKTLLVVGMWPGAQEDRAGRPNVGRTGTQLRRFLRKNWAGDVVFDNALRCRMTKRTTPAKSVDACRGYLAETWRQTKPDRILCLGAAAALSVLGRSVPVLSAYRSYCYLSDRTPVFMAPHPAAFVGNHFRQRQWDRHTKWALEAQPELPPWGASVRVFEPGDEDDVYAYVDKAKWLSVDAEWYGRAYDSDFRILSVAICGDHTEDSWVWLDPKRSDPCLRGILESSLVPKVGQNLKSDWQALRAGLGIELAPIDADTRLWRKLLVADAVADLEAMAELVGMGGHKAEAKAIIDKEKRRLRKIDPAIGKGAATYAYAALPPEVLAPYNALDAVATARLVKLFGRPIREAYEGCFQRTWDGLVGPASWAVSHVERWGFLVDEARIEAFIPYLDAKLDKVREDLAPYPGLNPNSAKQVGKLLFETLGLPVVKRTATGQPSTDKDVMEAVAGQHPVANAIMRYRTLTKLRSTYAMQMLRTIQEDGRVHTSFSVYGARTGRMSCSEPGLHQIPRPETAEGKMIRDFFIAPPGRVLVQADFKTLEVRVAGMLSGDPALIAVFERGGDPHMDTAKLIAPMAWGIESGAVTKFHRTATKKVVFGLLFGESDKGLAEQLTSEARRAGLSIIVTERDAAKIRQAVLGEFHVLAAWINEQLAQARRSAACWTYWTGRPARRRPLWGIGSPDIGPRGNAERASCNSPIQGTASDFCLAALADCVRWILDDCVPAKLVLTVHDSLMFEVDEDAVDELVWQVNRIMTGYDSQGVPLAVDFEIGPSWGSLEPMEVPK